MHIEVRQAEYSERLNTRAMLEFFVLRKYRKHGVGSHAASAILTMTPANWEIGVIPQNPAAARLH